MTPQRWAVLPNIVPAALVAAAVLIFIEAYHRHDKSLGNTLTSVSIKLMKQGYDCHAAGRTFEDCEAEQRNRWRRVQTEGTDASLPKFGERAP